MQTAFCQEGFQGEEPERAFQVSPQAIFAAPCQVGLVIACQQDHPDSRLNNVDDLAKDPASACFLCCLMSRLFPQVTRPSSRRIRISGTLLQEILTSTYRKRGAPDCFFCWLLPGFRFWQAGAWKRVEDESEVLRQNTTRPNPRLRDRPIQLPHDGVTARQDCYGFLPRRAT